MIYELSPIIDQSLPIFEGNPTYRREFVRSMKQGHRSNGSEFQMGAHTGSHIDAPLHMIADGSDVTQYSADALIGPATVLEIDDSEAVTLEELEKHSLSGVTRLLLRTKNSLLWKQNNFHKNFVYIESDAAQFLASQSLKLLGFDYLSVEKFGSKKYSAHLPLLEKQIVILEGLDLSQVPAGNYILFCGPLRLKGGEGAPARVFLVEPETVKNWVR